MEDKRPEAADASKEATARKKKTKRTSRKDPALSTSSNRASRQGRDIIKESTAIAGTEEEHRRRSKSSDKKASRDSGSRREKERSVSNSNNQNEAAAEKTSSSVAGEGSERKRSQARGGIGGSGKHSPTRIRKSRSEGGARSCDNHAGVDGSLLKDRSRSRSPATRAGAGSAPRLPQRTTSESSDLRMALESVKVDEKDTEEASLCLGDFRQQKQGSRLGASLMESRQKMGGIPEESLGSFTAFAKKYEQEELLGLHDDPGLPGTSLSPNGQSPDEQSCSLGGIMNPMNHYGGAPKAPLAAVEESLGSFTGFHNPMNQCGGAPKAPKAAVEESLGSFAAFNTKYEEHKLLGLLNDSNMSDFLVPPPKQKEPDIPEESMGDFAQLTAQEEKGTANSGGLDGKGKSKRKEGNGEENFFEETVLPSSRIEKLGKRGGIGYKLMVDSPGGHWAKPMKIVVAIEFEDDSDSDENDEHKDEDVGPHEKVSRSPKKIQKETDELATELEDSGHLPLSPVPSNKKDDAPQKQQTKKKKHRRKANDGPRKSRPRKMKSWHEGSEENDSDAEEDNVNALPTTTSRWRNQTRPDGTSLKQPEREKSRSTHSTISTVSSVTIESALKNGEVSIQADACPSNPNFVRKPPGFKSAGGLSNSDLRKPSGAIQLGGTASLLKLSSMVAPHNLGTRRGLMLRQMSQASMKSTVSAKSNDSSWVNPNNDLPDDYQASFMQLNLMDLEKPQMQTNEEVELAELPDALLSGVEEIEMKESKITSIAEELGAIPEGKDPQVAASELLGMKTMLKHIKRVAPKRSKSFDFDRDTPKQMWNSLFARSQKGDLPGSQYVDHDSSTGGDDDDPGHNQHVEENEPNTGVVQATSSTEVADYQEEKCEAPQTTVKAGIFSTIKRVATTGVPSSSAPNERSSSKGKSSLWMTSAIKRVITSGKDSNQEQDPNQDQTNTDDDDNDKGDDGGGDDEGSIELGELDGDGQDLEEDAHDDHHDEEEERGGARSPGRRRRNDDRGNEGSTRGPRSGRLQKDAPKKGGAPRSRAARAQQFHNRSMTAALDYYSAEHNDDDDGAQLDAINELEESKRRTRVRARRKVPNRTRSDDSVGLRPPPCRAKSSDAMIGIGRTKDISPTRPMRDTSKRMHQSFTGVDPGDLPSSKPDKPRESASRHPGVARSRSHDKGTRGSVRKSRPARKKSASGDEPESSGHMRAALPADATEKELREILDYH